MVYHINGIKNKKSCDPLKKNAEKAFDKMQQLFMIKALNKFSIEGINLKLIKTYMASAFSSVQSLSRVRLFATP